MKYFKGVGEVPLETIDSNSHMSVKNSSNVIEIGNEGEEIKVNNLERRLFKGETPPYVSFSPLP